MVQRISSAQAVALQNLRQRFVDWRDAGRSGKRIPEELWQAATDMARQVGVNRAAKAAGLDYSKLKRRLNGGVTQATNPGPVTCLA